MIRTRSGLPRTHALIRQTLYAQPAPKRQRSKHGPRSPSPTRSLLSSTQSTRQPNALHRSTARTHSRPCGAAQPPQGPYSPTRRWQQRSGRNHAGEAAAVAFVPEFLPSIPFPKNSGATAIGGMIRTRSGLPKHAQHTLRR
ncbi:hypothetical protein [Paenibacillus cellulositrophicus]|uniref:hypothetical protein n=1 Tax=Paenibacillus cellulositrophicus TaxID=562959 RepID=UPI0012671968|nr:hypothetical protein [Paenibacillus cellulositrophicus]